MESQLRELIDTIKAEGVQTAEKQAEQIIAAAEERARAITAQAQKSAEQITSDAKRDRQRQEAAGMEAIRQAARDLILGVQTQLVALFKNVVEKETSAAFSGEVLEKAVVAVVQSWASESEQGIEVLLSDSERSRLEASLRGKLSAELASGVVVTASPTIKSGFRLSTKDGTVYYDFGATAVADALSAYLSPRLAEAVREAAQGA